MSCLDISPVPTQSMQLCQFNKIDSGMRYVALCRRLYCLKQTLCPFCPLNIYIFLKSQNVLGADDLFNFEMKPTKIKKEINILQRDIIQILVLQKH